MSHTVCQVKVLVDFVDTESTRWCPVPQTEVEFKVTLEDVDMDWMTFEALQTAFHNELVAILEEKDLYRYNSRYDVSNIRLWGIVGGHIFDECGEILADIPEGVVTEEYVLWDAVMEHYDPETAYGYDIQAELDRKWRPLEWVTSR